MVWQVFCNILFRIERLRSCMNIPISIQLFLSLTVEWISYFFNTIEVDSSPKGLATLISLHKRNHFVQPSYTIKDPASRLSVYLLHNDGMVFRWVLIFYCDDIVLGWILIYNMVMTWYRFEHLLF